MSRGGIPPRNSDSDILCLWVLRMWTGCKADMFKVMPTKETYRFDARSRKSRSIMALSVPMNDHLFTRLPPAAPPRLPDGELRTPEKWGLGAGVWQAAREVRLAELFVSSGSLCLSLLPPSPCLPPHLSLPPSPSLPASPPPRLPSRATGSSWQAGYHCWPASRVPAWSACMYIHAHVFYIHVYIALSSYVPNS